MARYSDKPARVYVGNKTLTWGKGQIAASIRFLAVRWKWSNDKVQRFLHLLTMENVISCSTTQCRTLITILTKKQVQQTERIAEQEQVQLNPLPVSDAAKTPNADKYSESDALPDASRTLASTKQKEGCKKGEKKNISNKEIQYAFDLPEFKIVFDEWIQFRHQKKKPLTALAIKKQNELLQRFTVTEAIEMINSSIIGDYQGLFPLKNKKNENGKSAGQTREERLRDFVAGN